MSVPKIWRKIPEYYNLIGRRCPACDALYFPAREVCTSCGAENLDEHCFEGVGNIVTFTIVRTQVFDPEHETIEIPSRHVPYVLAIIQLKEGPLITTEIVDTSPEEISIGLPVEVVFRKIREKGKKGIIHYGYKFRLKDV